ncbi:MAG: polyphosphate kinase 1, partial [Pseudomonadota bacterium]
MTDIDVILAQGQDSSDAMPVVLPTYALAERYINRELSLLDFHLRVLEQAVDPLHPLLERLNFLLIFSRNMDEFFEIRVAGLLQKLSFSDEGMAPDGLRPSDILAKIGELAHAAIERQYRILNDDVLPALARENIRFLRRDELTPEQNTWVKQYFREQVLPVLTPISLDPAHPFPRL